MNHPGLKHLGDFQVAAAATQTGTWITGLEGMLSASFDARFAYGTGGETCSVIIQTSFNDGQSAVDIARFDFDTAGDERVCNLSSLQSLTIPVSAQSLQSEGSVDGVLSNRIRAVVISTGTYDNATVVSVNANFR